MFSICLAWIGPSVAGILKPIPRRAPGRRCGRETVWEIFRIMEFLRLCSQFVSLDFAVPGSKTQKRFCDVHSVAHVFLCVKVGTVRSGLHFGDTE